MKTFQIIFLAVVVLATSACATNGIQHPASAPAVHAPPTSAAETLPPSDDSSAPAPETPLSHDTTDHAGTVAGDPAVAETARQTELDTDAIDAPKLVRDPWEGFNRKIHRFNNAADEYILRPIAVGYKKITPEPLQASVSRFFANLSMPATMVNQALQGRPGDAARSLGRFAVNTTIGVGGLFDPASHFGLPMRDDEDFGQTLATWGWRDSRYLVLPLLGPHTVRDALGIVGDWPLSPISQVQVSGATSGMRLLEIVDVRTRLLPMDQFRRDALDDYLFVRNAWAQRRNHQIKQDHGSTRD